MRTHAWKHLLLTLVLGTALLFTGGCGYWQKSTLTVDQAEVAVYGGTYALSMAASKLAVQNDKLDLATAALIANTIETIEPYMYGLATSQDLYSVAYPLAEMHVKRFITDANYQALTLAVVGQAMRMADRYLENHPEFTQDRNDWMRIVDAIFKGAATGVRDGAALPKTVPNRGPATVVVPRTPMSR